MSSIVQELRSYAPTQSDIEISHAILANKGAEPGCRAWVDDGNEGTFENFLQDQAKINNKQCIIQEILAELEEMSLEELRELLEAKRDRNFIH